MDDSSKHTVYDVNTIANYDPAIIPLLDSPIGAAYLRDWETFEFIPDEPVQE